MRQIFVIFIAVFFTHLIYAQDLIVKQDGNRIECTITKVDSVNIHYSLHNDRDYVDRKIAIQEVQ